jgi:hypothetical protein
VFNNDLWLSRVRVLEHGVRRRLRTWNNVAIIGLREKPVGQKSAPQSSTEPRLVPNADYSLHTFSKANSLYRPPRPFWVCAEM